MAKGPAICVRVSNGFMEAAKRHCERLGNITVPSLMRTLLKSHLTCHATLTSDQWPPKPYTAIRIYQGLDGYRAVVHDDISTMADIDTLLSQSGDINDLLSITIVPNRNVEK